MGMVGQKYTSVTKLLCKQRFSGLPPRFPPCLKDCCTQAFLKGTGPAGSLRCQFWSKMAFPVSSHPAVPPD